MLPIRIAPSLLAADFARLADAILTVERGGADWLHVDVMDGHFVPNLTIGPPVVQAIRAVASVPLDVHLMIEEPWEWADRFLDAGANVLTIHVERARTRPDDSRALLDHVRGRGARAGMAVNPDHSAADVAPFLPHLDMVLVMSVFPGFGGQQFMPEVLETTRALRTEHRFGGDIEMDGGIDLETIGRCASAGANVFVSGTGVFGADDVGARIAELRARAEAAR